MTRWLLGMATVVCLASPIGADDFLYHGSFLWNDVRAIVCKDNYLLCAFHDGIGAVNLGLDFSKKKLAATLEIDGKPLRLHLFVNTLVVEIESGDIVLVDVADPMRMEIIGSFNPGLELFDLELAGDYLYAAVEYDGIVRFAIRDPGDIHFDDSSMAGIRVTQLDADSSRLYALDAYNGILVYEPDSSGFGTPVAELLLPISGISLEVVDDTAFVGTNPNGYMVGDLSDINNPEYLGLRASFIRGDQIARTARGLVLSNSVNGFELIYGADSVTHQLFPITGVRGFPDVYNFEERNYIVYPHRTRGFVGFDIDFPEDIDLGFPDLVYAYPGPITQVQFVNSRLHVIGINNWYETYDVSDPVHPVRTGKMINPPYKPIGMCAKGDTLFVADLETNAFFPAIDIGRGDPTPTFPFFGVADSIARPYLIPGFFEDEAMDLVYFYNQHHINGTGWSNGAVWPNVFRWSFPTGVSSAVIHGNLVYLASDKGMLFVNKIESDYSLREISQFGSPGRMFSMILRDTLLYMVGGSLMTYSVAQPLNPALVHRVDDISTAFDLQLVEPWLLCASRTGIHIFDISAGIPQNLFSSGYPAAMAATDGHLLAASDSFSVRLYSIPAVDVDDDFPIASDYDLPRLYGYPNPFNPSITLVLENFHQAKSPPAVAVYDILGRLIRRLSANGLGGGRPQIGWDGRDEQGRPVPSGVYFFQAEYGGQRAVCKAIMLK